MRQFLENLALALLICALIALAFIRLGLLSQPLSTPLHTGPPCPTGQHFTMSGCRWPDTPTP